MNRPGLLTAAIGLMLLSAGSSAVRAGFPGIGESQGQPEWPKFFAVEIGSETDVLDPENALGKPDDAYAEILPGGELIIVMEQEFYFSPISPGIGGPGEGGAADSGSVAGRGGADIDLEGLFPVRDSEGNSYREWMPLGISGTGFLVSSSAEPVASSQGRSGVDTIRITNYSVESIFVDAVIGYDLRPEGSYLYASQPKTAAPRTR